MHEIEQKVTFVQFQVAAHGAVTRGVGMGSPAGKWEDGESIRTPARSARLQAGPATSVR